MCTACIPGSSAASSSSRIHPWPPKLAPRLSAGAHNAQQLRMETNLRSILRNPDNGCGGRMVKPLAIVRWPGMWLEDPKDRDRIWWQVRRHQSCCICLQFWKLRDCLSGAPPPPCFPASGWAMRPNDQLSPAALQPTYAYLMRAYDKGSVAGLLADICHRCCCC